MGGVLDIFTGGNDDALDAQRRAMEQQRLAQERQNKIQNAQMKQQQAREEQAQNKANKEVADAAGAVEEAHEVTNESNLTGGLGVDPNSLQLGSPTLLGDSSFQNPKDEI